MVHRLFAGLVVTKSNLSKPAKLQLFNWLRDEATDAQVKAFLLDGKIVKLTSQEEKTIHERYLYEQGWTLSGLLSYVGAFDDYRDVADKAKRDLEECKGYGEGLPAKICKLEAQKREISAKINILKSSLAKCNQIKRSDACRLQLNKKIESLRERFSRKDEELRNALQRSNEIDVKIRRYKALAR